MQQVKSTKGNTALILDKAEVETMRHCITWLARLEPNTFMSTFALKVDALMKEAQAQGR